MIKKLLLLFCFVAFTISNDVLAQSQPEKKSNAKELIIYGSNDCHHCIDTKKYLDEHKVAYIFYDIDKNPDALKEMLNKLRVSGISTSNLGIPVVDKNGILFTNNGVFEEFLKKLIQ
jgi:glutaredoxin 3